MLRDEVWLSANPQGSGMLCIRCLEARLGRSLKPEDFTDCFLNRTGGLAGHSDRLRLRLDARACSTA